MAILESWLEPSHWKRELAIVYKGLWPAITAPERSMESVFKKLWVSSTEQDEAWRGAQSRELKVKLREGKEIQKFIEKQEGQQKNKIKRTEKEKLKWVKAETGILTHILKLPW